MFGTTTFDQYVIAFPEDPVGPAKRSFPSQVRLNSEAGEAGHHNDHGKGWHGHRVDGAMMAMTPQPFRLAGTADAGNTGSAPHTG